MAKKRIFEQAMDGHEGMVIEDNKIYRYRTQNTDPYYKLNSMLRDNIKKEAVTKSWALPVANIPYADYQELVKKNPDLKSPDASIRTAAWLKVLKASNLEQVRTVRKNLIPDSANPDAGSIILPKDVISKT